MKERALNLTLQDAVLQSGHYHLRRLPVQWEAQKTGAILCDMWDRHWCESATRRVMEMAPRLNAITGWLREAGVQIVHAPSETMAFYADTPQRKNTLEAARGVELAPYAEGEERLAAEPPLLVDREGVECDCSPKKCQNRRAWTRQTELIDIAPGDFIGEGLEILQALHARGILRVLMLGVHTNMCILGRPFAIRNMVRYGFSPVLVRDLTDCRATNEEPPFCQHFTALDYVIWHIEKYLCPTVRSGELLGDGQDFRSREDTRSERPSGEQLERMMADWLAAQGKSAKN